MKLTHHNIQGDTPSSHFQIPVYEFGDKNAPHKIYLQAGMHADEHPGMLVLNHLMDTFEASRGRWQSERLFYHIASCEPFGACPYHTSRTSWPLSSYQWVELQSRLARFCQDDRG